MSPLITRQFVFLEKERINFVGRLMALSNQLRLGSRKRCSNKKSKKIKKERGGEGEEKELRGW